MRRGKMSTSRRSQAARIATHTDEVEPAATQYVDRDGAALAYQVVGAGPTNLVFYFEITQHLDFCWTDPHIHHNFERMSRLGRAVFFQRRGFGLSDPVPYVPTLEQQAEDVLAVMDAADMDRAMLFGIYGTCAPVAMVAACAPERVSSLVLYMPYANGLPHGSRVPPAWNPDEAAAYAQTFEAAFEQWGSGLVAPLWDEALDTSYNRRLARMLERSSATPASARAYADWLRDLDCSDVLAAVHVPTYAVRSASDRLPAAVVRNFAQLVPDAVYHELPALGAGSSLGEGYTSLIDYAEQLISGADRPVATGRSLGTVLFTDVVGSTDLVVRLGDDRYREIRDTHERQVHLAVDNAGGELLKVQGDGTLSILDGPDRAIRCANVIRRDAASLGLELRAGIHTGELERIGPDVAGLTVHIAARVSAAAGAGEILVSRAVRDLVVGSGVVFADRGVHDLKGVPGKWPLFAVLEQEADHALTAADAPARTLIDRAAVATARRAPAAVRTMLRVGNSVQKQRARWSRHDRTG